MLKWRVVKPRMRLEVIQHAGEHRLPRVEHHSAGCRQTERLATLQVQRHAEAYADSNCGGCPGNLVRCPAQSGKQRLAANAEAGEAAAAAQQGHEGGIQIHHLLIQRQNLAACVEVG